MRHLKIFKMFLPVYEASRGVFACWYELECTEIVHTLVMDLPIWK